MNQVVPRKVSGQLTNTKLLLTYKGKKHISETSKTIVTVLHDVVEKPKRVDKPQ